MLKFLTVLSVVCACTIACGRQPEIPLVRPTDFVVTGKVVHVEDGHVDLTAAGLELVEIKIDKSSNKVTRAESWKGCIVSHSLELEPGDVVLVKGLVVRHHNSDPGIQNYVYVVTRR